MASSDMAGSEAFWESVYSHWPLTPDEAANELHDWHLALHEVPKVYDEITGGRLTKPNTMAGYVLDAAREDRERDVAEARDEGAEGLVAWVEGCGYLPPTGADGYGAPFATWAEVLAGYRGYVRAVAELATEAGEEG